MTEEQERILRLKKKQWVIIIRPFIRPRGEDRTLVLSEKWNKDAGQPVHWEDLELAPKHTDEEYEQIEKQLTELIKTYEEWRVVITDQKVRIKELTEAGNSLENLLHNREMRIKELEDENKAWKNDLLVCRSCGSRSIDQDKVMTSSKQDHDKESETR